MITRRAFQAAIFLSSTQQLPPLAMTATWSRARTRSATRSWRWRLRCELAAQDRPMLSEFLELKKAPMTSAFVKGFG
jgi:hypothetical protein